MKQYSEEDLVRCLKEGDEKAFKHIFDTFYRPLTLFAIKYVGDPEEAREIVQDFFVRLWVKHAEITIHFSLKAYLYNSVKNTCFNALESNKVAQRHMRDYRNPEASNLNALENMLAAEQEDRLMRAIDQLPEKCKRIFFMSRMEKLSNQAIADMLQLSIKTVEAQITIALKRLRDVVISISVLFFSYQGIFF